MNACFNGLVGSEESGPVLDITAVSWKAVSHVILEFTPRTACESAVMSRCRRYEVSNETLIVLIEQPRRLTPHVSDQIRRYTEAQRYNKVHLGASFPHNKPHMSYSYLAMPKSRNHSTVDVGDPLPRLAAQC